jgi:hypothetical protein
VQQPGGVPFAYNAGHCGAALEHVVLQKIALQKQKSQ